MDQDADDFSETHTSGRMLDDFIKDREGAALDDEDDDDIYARYREMADRDQKPVNRSARDGDAPFTANIDELRPKMPGFEDYFQSEADGVHPFDRVA